MKTNEISWLIKKFKIWRKNYFLVKLIKIQVLFQLLKIKLLWILNFRAYLCCFDIFCIVYWHFMLFFGPLHWQPPVAKGLFFLQEFQMMVIKGKFDHLQIIKIWLQFFERGCSFFIACATILCGGLDFQDIWVKTSDILPYLYGYGLKKKNWKFKKNFGFFKILLKFLDFFLVFWP